MLQNVLELNCSILIIITVVFAGRSTFLYAFLICDAYM